MLCRDSQPRHHEQRNPVPRFRRYDGHRGPSATSTMNCTARLSVPPPSGVLPPQDADPPETREWLDAFDAVVAAEGGERATFLLRKLLEHARRRRVTPAAGVQHALPEHDRPRRAAAYPGQPRHRAAPERYRTLERARDGGAREPRESRPGRPHRELRVGRRPLRSRLQPLLPRGAGRRPRLFPAALGAGRVCARVSRRPPVRGPASRTTGARPAARGCRRIRIRG